MPDGFINVLKPPGMTSHDVVSYIRRIYGEKKVGHTGTLDPGAAGVLPVAVGKATRLIEYIADADKSYRVELTFGYETDSGDDAGSLVRAEPVVMPDHKLIEHTLKGFAGENLQIPPMHSAIKVNGKKLYDMARKGITIDVPPRKVQIYGVFLLLVKAPSLLFDVNCSKGTYIRSLCADIGKVLRLPCTMSFLVRTRSGGFSLSDSATLEEIKENPFHVLQSMDGALPHFESREFDHTQSIAFQQGQRIKEINDSQSSCMLRIYDDFQRFIGVGKYDPSHQCIIPEKVIARSNL